MRTLVVCQLSVKFGHASLSRACPKKCSRDPEQAAEHRKGQEKRRARGGGERGRHLACKGKGKENKMPPPKEVKGNFVPKSSRTCAGREGPTHDGDASNSSARRRARGDGAAGEGHLEEAGGSEGARVERRKPRAALSEKVCESREQERTKNCFWLSCSCSLSKNQKRKLGKELCKAKSFCFLRPFAPFPSENPAPASEGRLALHANLCVPRVGSSRRVLKLGRVGVVLTTAKLLNDVGVVFVDFVQDVEIVSDTAVPSAPASCALVRRSPADLHAQGSGRVSNSFLPAQGSRSSSRAHALRRIAPR